ncbi:MAG: dihydrofolate reductase family protein [Pararhodobacter sp.]|nr:dihydrofolate reductase family protein [Pararhodobacter sp.]
MFGSADLTATLLEGKAIDEIRLCLVPVILGGGNPLFKSGGIRKDFNLLGARPFRSGGVLPRYLRADG